jgi:small-conductance mechanosensitive channel
MKSAARPVALAAALILLLTGLVPLAGFVPLAGLVPLAHAQGGTVAKQAAEAPALSAADAERALAALKDPKRRAELIATLEALAAAARLAPANGHAIAQKGAAKEAPAQPQQGAGQGGAATQPAAQEAAPQKGGQPAAEPPPADAAKPALPIELAPDSLGAELVVGASTWLSGVMRQVSDTLRALNGLPALWAWLVVITTDPLGRQELIGAAWRLALVFAAGLALEFPLRHLLRRPARALATRAHAMRLHATGGGPKGGEGEARAEAGETEGPRGWAQAGWTLLRRLPFALARFLLALLPALAFAVAAHLVAANVTGTDRLTHLILLVTADAYVGYRVVLALGGFVLAPTLPELRLMPVSDAAAEAGMRWLRRLAVVNVFGYAGAEVGLLFGLSFTAHAMIMKAIGLITTIFLARIVVHNRETVAGLLRPRKEADGLLPRLRGRLAPIWHHIAVYYLLAAWVVWAINIPDGLTRLLRFSALTASVLIAGRILLVLLKRGIDAWINADDQAGLRAPWMVARLATYRRVARRAATLLVTAITLIALVEVWGLDLLAWLTQGSLGPRLFSTIVNLVLTLALATAVWEGTNIAIEGHLARLAREAQLARSARLRTLLPMLRTTLLILLLVIVGLIALAAIGVNIAPLLAGAGVIGLAIGFGSQKLVQDLITGLFLLLENAMQVGDVVSLGGLSGVVEDLSVRTIRLRALDGSVHIIPFSAVTTVTNMTRDFSYAVIDASVAYKEDIDRVGKVLREIAAGMREEPRWRAAMRDDLELLGLDRFLDSSIVIRARIKTQPMERWNVEREFRRRMKIRFDELGIEIPFPHQKLVVEGSPPPGALPGPIAAALAAPEAAGGSGKGSAEARDTGAARGEQHGA